MPMLSGGPTAPLSGCCCRTQRKQGGPHLLHLRQCGTFRLTGDYSYGSTTTLGSQNARGPVAVVGPCRERERRVRPPALDLPGCALISYISRVSAPDLKSLRCALGPGAAQPWRMRHGPTSVRRSHRGRGRDTRLHACMGRVDAAEAAQRSREQADWSPSTTAP